MSKHDIIVTILGTVIGVAMVLVFSFVIAEVLPPVHPKAEAPPVTAGNEGQNISLAASVIIRQPSGAMAQTPALMRGGQPVTRVTSQSFGSAAPHQPAMPEAPIPPIGAGGLVVKTVTELEGAIASLTQQVSELTRQLHVPETGQEVFAPVGGTAGSVVKLVNAVAAPPEESQASKPSAASGSVKNETVPDLLDELAGLSIRIH